MNNKDSSQHIVTNIIAYSQTHRNLLNKYNLDFFLNYLDRDAILEMTEYIQPHQRLTVEEFVRIFLLKIDHPDDQTLYLALSVKQFYEAILERTSCATNYIEFSDFTTYLCEKISKQDLDVVIAPKKTKNDCYADQSAQTQSEIDLNPTIISSKVHAEIPKINKDQPKRNKKLQEKKGVSKFFYSTHMNKIIAVGSLTSSIYIYHNDLTHKRELKPRIYKEIEKDLAILSIGYSHRSNRIAALLTNGIMVFWQGCDNFATEKYISTRNCGQKITHLQMLNQWITYDKSSVYFWDLKEQAITQTIVCKDSAFINDICEIDHMRAICLSVVSIKQEKYLLIYHKNKKVAKISLQNAGCHTLHYNKLTQSLLPLGYHSIIPVYSISGVEFDTQMKYILRGHKSIITCIDSLQSSTLLITGDDLGEIRVWQLAYMRCIQSIKLSKWLGGIRWVGDRLYFSDSRINVMQLQHFQTKTMQTCTPLQQFYDQNAQILWVITKKDARSINIQKGRVSQIYTLCNEDQQISAATQLPDGFVIGNSKGEIFKYDSDCNLKWRRQAHEGEVKQLLFDRKNRLIFSMGAEGRITALPERNTALEQQRKMIVFRRKQINYMRLAQKSDILIVGQLEQKQLTIWDYQTLKLFQVLQMQSPITAVFSPQKLDLIIIATKDLNVALLKFAKKEQELNLSRVHSFNVQLNQIHQQTPTQMQHIIDLKMISLNQDTTFYLVASTNKGTVITYDISTIINSHFVIQNSLPNESANMLRSQKEQFESSFSQRGRQQAINTLPNLQRQDIAEKLLWRKKITKDAGISLFEVDINENMFGAICQDYTKLLNLNNGDIQASLNINQTLPIKWDLTIDRFNSLKKHIYETLNILDNILRNNGYELLAKQYQKINITNFIEQMKSLPIHPTQLNKVYSIEHKRHINPVEKLEEPTLKSLQAYKRVKNIKKITEESMHLPALSDSVKTKQSQFEKYQIADFLMSNSTFTEPHGKRSCRATHIDPYLQSLQSKLCESVTLPSDKKKLRTTKMAESNEMRKLGSTKSSGTEDVGLRSLQSKRKNMGSNKENDLRWQKELQQRSIKQILGNLNSKLKNCRQRYSRNSHISSGKL